METEIAEPSQYNSTDPTSLVPPEILVEVFSYFSGSYEELARITGVCRRWRAIAIHAPYLWTKITVIVHISTYKEVKSLLSLVDLCLGRSGELLLDVFLHFALDDDVCWLAEFVNVFRNHGSFSRWNRLALDIAPDANLEPGELRDTDNFSNLDTLLLISPPPHYFLDLINKTATSKFFYMELCPGVECSPQVPVRLTRKLTLAVPVSLEQILCHDLSRLLHISIDIPYDPAGHILHFPSLLSLEMRGSNYSALAAFSAPKVTFVKILGSRSRPETMDGTLAAGLRNRLHGARLLWIDLYLFIDGPLFLHILHLYPTLKVVSFPLNDVEYMRSLH